MYYAGLGVAKDNEKAKEFYRMAADKDKNAELLLKELEMQPIGDWQINNNIYNVCDSELLINHYLYFIYKYQIMLYGTKDWIFTPFKLALLT